MHGIKFKEWSLRLKLARVDDKTMLLGRESSDIYDSVCKEMAMSNRTSMRFV